MSDFDRKRGGIYVRKSPGAKAVLQKGSRTEAAGPLPAAAPETEQPETDAPAGGKGERA